VYRGVKKWMATAGRDGLVALGSFALVSCFVTMSCAALAFSQTEHDRLIERARGGDAVAALRDMQQALAVNPTNVRLRRDVVVVANWAEEHEKVVREYEKLGPGQPSYVVSVAALSYRRLEHWKPAIEAYQRVVRAEPKNYEAQAGLVLSTLGDEQVDTASALLDAFLPKSPRERRQKPFLPLIEALAMVREKQERWSEALAAWQDALALNPEFAGAKTAIVFVSSRLGAASLANERAKAIGAPRIAPDSQLRLAQDKTAHEMRHGDVQLALDAGAKRFEWTDRALASNAADRKAAPPASQRETNTMLDRLVALRDRVKMDEALKLYEEIKARNVKVPPYALAAVADAYLYMRKPIEARDHYLQALDATAKAGGKPAAEWQFALIYAYLECEQWQAASDLSDELLAKLKPFHYEKSPLQRDNPDYAQARVMRALLDLYGDRLVPAKAWLDEFMQLAPHNLSARSALANWYSANNMPNHSNEEFLRIKAEDPKFLSARLGLAETDLSLARWREARAAAKEISEDYPENRAVERLQDILRAHDAPSVRVTSQMTWAVNDGPRDAIDPRPSKTNRDWKVDAYAYSMPIAEDYRLFGHAFVSEADFLGFKGRRERYGIGVDREVESLALGVEAHVDRRPGSTAGISLSATYTPNDEWRARASVDTNTTDIALRASLADIQAKQFSVSVDRRFPFLRNLNAGLSHYRFTDGNKRTALSGTWHERWLSEPRYKLDMDLALYTSRNTLRDAPYFNPSKDASADVTLHGELLTWRDYEKSLKQRLIGTAGAYWQEGFGTAPVLGIKYEHEWENQRQWVVRYGVGWTKRPYDGVQEQRAQVYLDFDWKLK
jgi:biofilm PGA synthesis protein PgaA